MRVSMHWDQCYCMYPSSQKNRLNYSDEPTTELPCFHSLLKHCRLKLSHNASLTSTFVDQFIFFNSQTQFRNWCMSHLPSVLSLPRKRHFSCCSHDNLQVKNRKHNLLINRSANEVTRWLSSYNGDSSEEKQPAWKILFFGTDEFSLTCLRTLNTNRQPNGLIQQLDVIVPQSKYIKKVGRRDKWLLSPVLQYAEQSSLQVHHWPLTAEVKGYDLGVVASFGHLIPGKIIRSFPQGVLNVHPSLLPKWRGAAPIIHTILNNDAETGVTIMKLQPKRFDVGPILHQKAMTTPTDCTSQSLRDTLANIGADMLLEVLKDLPTFTSQERPQTEDMASYGGKIYSDHAVIDWSKSVEDIYRQYRAISFLIPLHTRWRDQRIVLRTMGDSAKISDLSTKYAAACEGQVHYHEGADLLCIKCKNGWVGFEHITIERKGKLSAKDFYNGYLSSTNAEMERFR